MDLRKTKSEGGFNVRHSGVETATFTNQEKIRICENHVFRQGYISHHIARPGYVKRYSPCTSIVFFPVGALTASWSKVMISPEEKYEINSSESTQYSVLVRPPWPHYLPWPSSPCSLPAKTQGRRCQSPRPALRLRRVGSSESPSPQCWTRRKYPRLGRGDPTVILNSKNTVLV